MLLKDLPEVNQIDTAIAELHQQLSSLYKKRTQLIQNDISLSHVPAAYDLDTLRTIWQHYSIDLPRTKAFTQKYSNALELLAKLETHEPSLRGSLVIVITPPSEKLVHAIQGLNRYSAVHDKLAASSQWAITIMAQHQHRKPIEDLAQFIDLQRHVIAGYDGRGLGVNELIAAELQGVQTTQAGNWTVLLKDAPEEGPLCATSEDGRLILDIEDANCLLGDNRFQMAITSN